LIYSYKTQKFFLRQVRDRWAESSDWGQTQLFTSKKPYAEHIPYPVRLGSVSLEVETLSPPYTRFPLNGESWPGLRNCEGGYEAVCLLLPFVFLFFLCAFFFLQRFRQNFRTPNLWRGSMGFRL